MAHDKGTGICLVNSKQLHNHYTINFINYKAMYDDFINSHDYLDSQENWKPTKGNEYELTYKF